MSTSLVARARAIILTPATEWPKIATEDTTSRDVLTGYVMPLALLAPVCGFIGGQVFGFSFGGFRVSPPLVSAAVGAAVTFVLVIASYLVLAVIADTLAPKFGGRFDTNRSARLIAYAATPVWLAGAAMLYPPLAPLTVLGLYSLYLTYTGATPMLGVPKERALAYTAVIVVCGLVLNMVIYGMSSMNMQLIDAMGLRN